MSDLDARVRAEWRAWLTRHSPDPVEALERLDAIDAADAARRGKPCEAELAAAHRTQASVALLHEKWLAKLHRPGRRAR